MKNTLFILIVLTAISCNDLLQEEPFSVIAPEFFYSNGEELQIALNGVYEMFSANPGGNNGGPFGNYRLGLLCMGNLGTDEVRAKNNRPGNRFEQMDIYAFTSSSEIPTDVWVNHYMGINRANALIERAPLANTTGEKKNIYIAEAKFLRALYYFNLVRFYGDVPLKLSETKSLTQDDVLAIARSPKIDVYKQIEADLLFAEQYLLAPNDIPDSQHGRASVTAAKALLAKVYLTWASKPIEDVTKWQLAAQKAKEVIESQQHSLLKYYPSVFALQNEGSVEHIFVIKFSYVDGTTGSLGSFAGVIGTGGASANTANNWAGFGVATALPSFWKSYHSLDARKAWNISDYRVDSNNGKVALGSETNLGMAKFRRDGSFISYSSPYDYPILRYSDVLLMYAEALNEINNGPNPEAYNAINLVRKRARFDGTSEITGAVPDLKGLDYLSFKNAVIQERSWELCYEAGNRWFDLVRTGQLVEKVLANGSPDAKKNIKEHHNLFPIPLKEIDVNPAITQADQNTGY